VVSGGYVQESIIPERKPYISINPLIADLFQVTPTGNHTLGVVQIMDTPHDNACTLIGLTIKSTGVGIVSGDHLQPKVFIQIPGNCQDQITIQLPVRNIILYNTAGGKVNATGRNYIDT